MLRRPNMSGLGRSIKPSYFSSVGRRPATPRRNLSSSSDLSAASSPRSVDDPFVFSAGNTPAAEAPPSTAAGSGITTSAEAPRSDAQGRSEPATRNPQLAEFPRLVRRTKPLPTDPPIFLKAVTSSVITPPESVSARGDGSGANTTLHEDVKSQLLRPPPFHLDLEKARHRIKDRTAEPVLGRSHSDRGPGPVATMSESPWLPATDGQQLNDFRAHTPATSSYIPMGHAESPIPTGKYYPSNYEKRTAEKHQSRPPSTSRTPHANSESPVPRHRLEVTPSSSTSEAKRRLQQYQRDMVAQATLAASELLGGVSRRGRPGLSDTGTAALDGILAQDAQLNGMVMRSRKPISPRLLPLGSPGPVTPMELEGGEGFWAVSNQIADRELERGARV